MPDAAVLRWQNELGAADKRMRRWETRAKGIIKRYRDERIDTARAGDDKVRRKLNFLWSNTEIIRPAIYARPPKPRVSRRHKDADPVARVASMILERSLDFAFEDYDFNRVMRRVVNDALLVGRGVARVFYEPTIVTMEDPFGDPVLDPETEEPLEEVIDEVVRCDYHDWRRFRHGFAPVWDDVPWIAFQNFMSRRALIDRFGEKGKSVSMTTEKSVSHEDKPQPKSQERGSVWEIWDRESGRVLWISEGSEEVLDQVSDPLGLKNFYPCPEPIWGVMTNDSLEPVPEFIEYQDQANELDQLTHRIYLLADAISVSGAYAGDAKAEIEKIINSPENTLVAVDNWAAFAERGGLRGLISWVPIQEIAGVLQILIQSRDAIKQDLFEVTGIADIIRGATNPHETAQAQRIKGTFANLRLKDRQDEVARFARDLTRLKAEIIAEKFDDDTIRRMSGFDLLSEARLAIQEASQANQLPEVAGPQGAPISPADRMFAGAVRLIRDEKERGFRIEIETDSTIALDEIKQKQDSRELMETFGGYIAQILPAIQEFPQSAPFLLEMLAWSLRGFPQGRDLEAKLEKAIDQINTQLAQPQEPERDPALERIDSNERVQREKIAAERERAQTEAQIKAAKVLADAAKE